MNLEGLEAIIDLIEMGAMSSNKDIAKCLRSAVAAIKERMSTENAHEREWVSLTDEEIDKIHRTILVENMGVFGHKDLYRPLEALLREKNT